MKAPVSELRKTSAGYSLIELVITIVVLGIALSALSGSLFFSVGHNADPLWQTKSSQLAQAYIDEILAMRFQEDSPPGGGAVAACNVGGTDAGESSRSLYDDVDDYNGLNQTGAFLDTAVTSDYSGYSVAVQVSCVNESGGATNNSKLIVVNITAPSGDQASFSALRGNF